MLFVAGIAELAVVDKVAIGIELDKRGVEPASMRLRRVQRASGIAGDEDVAGLVHADRQARIVGEGACLARP